MEGEFVPFAAQTEAQFAVEGINEFISKIPDSISCLGITNDL